MSVSGGGQWRSEGGGRGGRGGGQGGGRGRGKGGGRGGGSSCPRAPPGGGRQNPAKEFFKIYILRNF